MSSVKKFAAVAAVVKAARLAVRPGGPSLGQRAGAMPRMVRATLSGEYTGVTKGRLALMVAATGYIVSPIDLIPDVIGLAGLADDAVVMSWLATRFVEETERFLEWERALATPDAGASGPWASSGPGQGYGSTGGYAREGATGATGAPGGVPRASSQTVRGDVVG